MSLVLDEFALILHLQDVYWSGEGQLSVEAVTLTAACLGLALVGFTPFGIQGEGTIERTIRVSATVLLVIDGLFTVICVLKGKYRCALFGLFVAPVAWVGAVRLARPSSLWARRWYHGERLERATHRGRPASNRQYGVQADWVDFIGGDRPCRPGSPPGPPSRPASRPRRARPSPASRPTLGDRPLNTTAPSVPTVSRRACTGGVEA